MKNMRIMWLLNHGAAREFELAMLRRLGVREIFTPKTFPNRPGFRSASVDHSGDADLSLAASDLEILNATDWYGEPGRRAWEIANRHFDALFFTPHGGRNICSIIDNFRGAILLRAYGLVADFSYADTLEAATGLRLEALLRPARERFHFAEAYAHLHLHEPPALRERRLFLPLGLAESSSAAEPWQGANRKIFFVCPDIGLDGYYRDIYQRFLRDFGRYPHAIGGMQPVAVPDPNVLGFVPAEQHRANLRDFRLMYYHSAEPRHIHYHPFEAVRAGMPLVYLGGGMLDRLGGADLPGRCATARQAQTKIRRILDDDQRFIERIRASQAVLLEPLKFERCTAAWREAFEGLPPPTPSREAAPASANRRKRIALILPIAYRGGTLRGTALLARALQAGARGAGQEIDIVLGHRDEPEAYPPGSFDDFPLSVQRRPYQWKTFDAATAHRALIYAGREPVSTVHEYWVPDDGIAQFTDCDFWFVVSDRLDKPLLPLRPHALLVYDYIQRYQALIPATADRVFARAARAAERVFVTTEFTRRDVVQYAGVEPSRVVRLPMLVPAFTPPDHEPAAAADYFLWSTNLSIHKNHENAIRALIQYYCEHGGELECRISGVDTDKLFKSETPHPHLQRLPALLRAAPDAKQRIRVLGDLRETAYRQAVAAAAFAWHPCSIDNGTFSVVEAAACRVPALSSDYPAMREIDVALGLNLAWMDAHDPADMARALKRMETGWRERRHMLPSAESVSAHGPQALGSSWWEAVSQCL